jgi:hypothetical protein
LKPFSMKASDWGWLAFFMAVTILSIVLGRF